MSIACFGGEISKKRCSIIIGDGLWTCKIDGSLKGTKVDLHEVFGQKYFDDKEIALLTFESSAFLYFYTFKYVIIILALIAVINLLGYQFAHVLVKYYAF